MERKSIKNKRLILTLIFLSLFILGTFLIFTTPSSIKVTYGKTVETKDGETISFNVFEPRNKRDKKPAVLIGHGIMVNKEMLKGYAIELAAAGFVAIPFDFRGHGQSSGELRINLLINDVKAIKKYLEKRGDIDMDKLGYIGYSMGGIPGNKIVKKDDAFKCFIGVGTSLNIDYEDCINRTLNILMILAKYDQAFDLKNRKKEIADRLDIDDDRVQVNTLYGSFEVGDATKLYLDDNSDHFLTAYDSDFIREARDWVKSTFPGVEPVDQNFYANIRFLILILQMIGGIGFFLSILKPLCGLFLKVEEEDSNKALFDLKNQSSRDLLVKIFAYSFLFAVLGILMLIPFFLFLPISTAGFVLMLFYGQVVGLFIFLWKFGKKQNFKLIEILKEPFKSNIKNLVKQISLGILLATILQVILYLTFGLNYMGILPLGYPKLLWSPLYFLLVFTMFMIFGLVFYEILYKKLRESIDNKFKISIIVFSIQIIYLIAVIAILSLIMGSLFFTQFFYFMIPITLFSSIISTIIYEKTKKLLVGAIVNTVYITLLMCTLSPYILGLNLIMIFTH